MTIVERHTHLLANACRPILLPVDKRSRSGGDTSSLVLRPRGRLPREPCRFACPAPPRPKSLPLERPLFDPEPNGSSCTVNDTGTESVAETSDEKYGNGPHLAAGGVKSCRTSGCGFGITSTHGSFFVHGAARYTEKIAKSWLPLFENMSCGTVTFTERLDTLAAFSE